MRAGRQRCDASRDAFVCRASARHRRSSTAIPATSHPICAQPAARCASAVSATAAGAACGGGSAATGTDSAAATATGRTASRLASPRSIARSVDLASAQPPIEYIVPPLSDMLLQPVWR